MKPLVAAVILVALAVGAQAQTPEIDALRARAEQGDVDAQFNLGFMYGTGSGVPQDDAEAVRLYRLAAAQGHAAAQNLLGLLYTEGRGVVQDYVQAHMWCNLAASRSTGEARETAVEARDAVAGQMTPDDLSEAHRRAREWGAAHPREPYCTPGQPAVGCRCHLEDSGPPEISGS